MGFADKHRERERETREASEAKASEYAALSARVDDLENSINELKTTILQLNSTLQSISPSQLDEMARAGEKIFEPLKKTSAALNEEIKLAGRRAIDAVDEAGTRSIDWTGNIVIAALIVVLFSAVQFGIQYFFSPSVDYARRIMWNIEMRNLNQNLMVDFFDDEDDVEKIIKNELEYKKSKSGDSMPPEPLP